MVGQRKNFNHKNEGKKAIIEQSPYMADAIKGKYRICYITWVYMGLVPLLQDTP